MTFGHPSTPIPIADTHDLDSFDCGVQVLNDWLKKRALPNDRSGASRTYVLCNGNTVVGYYCLATGAVDHNVSPSQLRRNMPDPIPVVVLGRLAVDRRFQNQRLGRVLVRDAILRRAGRQDRRGGCLGCACSLRNSPPILPIVRVHGVAIATNDALLIGKDCTGNRSYVSGELAANRVARLSAALMASTPGCFLLSVSR